MTSPHRFTCLCCGTRFTPGADTVWGKLLAMHLQRRVGEKQGPPCLRWYIAHGHTAHVGAFEVVPETLYAEHSVSRKHAGLWGVTTDGDYRKLMPTQGPDAIEQIIKRAQRAITEPEN